MKSQVYIIIILFLSLKVSAQEKMSEEDLNSFFKKSNSKETKVINGTLFYKTFSMVYCISTKEDFEEIESKTFEINLNTLIVYRKEYNPQEKTHTLLITFRDKEIIEKTGIKTLTLKFKDVSQIEIDKAIVTLNSYYIKK
jgi:hypothetical protein